MRQGLGGFIVVIMILGMTGVAYAQWSEALYISGTVKTGELDARWSAGPSWDTEPPEKDVSAIKCYVDPGDETGHTLIVEVKNAYPSIDYYQLIDLHNTGTIPLHIWSIDIDDEGMPEGSTIEILDVDDVNVPDEHRDYITSDLDIEACEQVHPGETAYGVIRVHLPQFAEQGTGYSFSATLVVVQWNEGCSQEDGGEDEGGDGSDFGIIVMSNPGGENSPDLENENTPDQAGDDSDPPLDDGHDSLGGGEGDNSGDDDNGQPDVGDGSDNSDMEDNAGGQSEVENDDDDLGAGENESGGSGAGENTNGDEGDGRLGVGGDNDSDTGGEAGQSEQPGTGEGGAGDGNGSPGSDGGSGSGSTGNGEDGNPGVGGDDGGFGAEGDGSDNGSEGSGSGDRGKDVGTGSGEAGGDTGVGQGDVGPAVGHIGPEQGALAAGLAVVLISLLIIVFIGFMKPRKKS